MGPGGFEPPTNCSAGSHSIQAKLWTHLACPEVITYMKYPQQRHIVRRGYIPLYILLLI
jgi:hypothetical protein